MAVEVQHNPFSRGVDPSVNAGTVAIEQARASSEVQAQLFCAKQFPRDQAAAFSRCMEACRRPSLAAVAMYAFPRGKETISGPSIRLAETLAANWGNLEYGIRELSLKPGVSEMQAFAWDVETNVRSVQNFTVRHVRDTRDGKRNLIDERDIYEMTANQGGRRLRSRIMAILPGDLIEAAILECRRTLAGDNTVPFIDRVRKMIAVFDKLGVSLALLERKIGKPVKELLPDDLVELIAIHNSINGGMSSASDWFATTPEKETETANAIKGLASVPAAPPVVIVPAQTKDAVTEGRTATAPAVGFTPSVEGLDEMRDLAKSVGLVDMEDLRDWLSTLGEGWPQDERELTGVQYSEAMRKLPGLRNVPFKPLGGTQ